jgi:SAM-dependent methyltransferase
MKELTVTQPRPYTNEWRGLRHFFTEGLKSYRSHADARSRVAVRLEEIQFIEKCIRDAYGIEIRDLDLLEIGPGQVPFQLLYFSRQNRVVGIDINVVLKHKTPLGIWRVARQNGPGRAMKTMARGILGIDASFYRELRRQLCTPNLPFPRILCMDAQRMEFPDDSFDLVYSRSVFHCLPDAAKAIGEVRRVMRPGAVTYISLHLYTSPNGYSFTPVDSRTAEWPHLRGRLSPQSEDQSRNRLRLGEWKKLFSEIMPGCHFVLRGPDSPDLRARAIELQQSGDLENYCVEELVNFEFTAMWKKQITS